ncbi:hypothetical protein O7R10_01810 [Candidatus Phytoplasma sacchari]|uniref:Uncharacterized protein n=1 Tax=Candidatus Phytoplasma sacchari TaxID=2609813 RepID=A0ABY7M3Y4_9MOLU|nr:hypothetical protein O7R10_01810 [Candidatus Phytoplasma sacchari]
MILVTLLFLRIFGFNNLISIPFLSDTFLILKVPMGLKETPLP